MNKPRFAVADVEAALVKASGLITPAADILAKAYGSCTPATVRNYVKRHKRLQEAVNQTVEHALDLAEHKLLGAVTKGQHDGGHLLPEDQGQRARLCPALGACRQEQPAQRCAD